LDREHFIHARDLSYEAQAAVPILVAGAGVVGDMRHFQWVRQTIRTANTIGHSALMRRAGGRGLSAPQLREHLTQLAQGNEIEVDMNNGRTRVYRWRRRTLTGGGDGESE
jgi:hypothetical protein